MVDFVAIKLQKVLILPKGFFFSQNGVHSKSAKDTYLFTAQFYIPVPF